MGRRPGVAPLPAAVVLVVTAAAVSLVAYTSGAPIERLADIDDEAKAWVAG